MITLQMRRIRPGMITAQNIYNNYGGSYLTSGTRLTQDQIDRLKKIGIHSLSVFSTAEDFKADINLPQDIVAKKTRVAALKNVRLMFEASAKDKFCCIAPLQASARSIVAEVMEHQQEIVQLTDVRDHDTYTFAHSVNVAVLSAHLGTLLHLSKEDMVTLTLGGLMHDLGKLEVPQAVLDKEDMLTEAEFALIKKHPLAGRAIIEKMEGEPNLHALSLIAAQHHEHLDGSGYPKHLAGEQIDYLARIVAIADVYDALTSQRSYKAPYKPHIAYGIMKNLSQQQFDPELLELFFENVAVYPMTTVVQTNIGYGIVKEVYFGQTTRPLVCIFADRSFHLLREPFLVDLRCNPTVSIESVMEDTVLMAAIDHVRMDPIEFLVRDYPCRCVAASPAARGGEAGARGERRRAVCLA